MAQVCFSIACVFKCVCFCSEKEKKNTLGPCIIILITYSSSNALLSVLFLLYLVYLLSLRSATLLEHGNWVRGIRRPRLRHVPMLNDAGPIHPVDVRQRNGFLVRLIDTHVDEADVVVEALSEHRGGDERND